MDESAISNEEEPSRAIEARLRNLVFEILLQSARKAAAFTRDDTLAEIGLGSMDMISLMLAVESEFQIEIPQEEITPEAFRSVATIEALVVRRSSAKAMGPPQLLLRTSQ
jgi:acyl carrier protein